METVVGRGGIQVGRMETVVRRRGIVVRRRKPSSDKEEPRSDEWKPRGSMDRARREHRAGDGGRGLTGPAGSASSHSGTRAPSPE
jgi:hypothetical protein